LADNKVIPPKTHLGEYNFAVDPISFCSDFFVEHVELKQYLDPQAKQDQLVEIPLEMINDFDMDVCKEVVKAPNEAKRYFEESLRDAKCGLVDVRFTSKNDFILTPCEQIKTTAVGQLVEIKGEIMGLTSITKHYELVAFACPNCGNSMQETQDWSKNLHLPAICSNPNCGSKKDFKVMYEISDGYDARYGFIQDLGDERKITKIILIKEDTKLKPGARVNLFGIVCHEIYENRDKLENKGGVYLLVHSQFPIGTRKHHQVLTDSSRIYLTDTGIFIDQLKESTGHELKIETEGLFQWDELKVEHRFRVQVGPVEQYRYEGFVRIKNNKNGFYNANISEIKKILQVESAVSGKNINFCTIPLQSYLSEFQDESEKITEVMGFTSKGWRLPTNSLYIIQDQKGLEIYKNLKENLNEKYDIPKIKRDFKLLYEKTGMIHKDQQFQWGLISPFLYVFREIGGIMPGNALQGPPQTGKSRILEMIMTRWYGHLKKVISAGTLKSASRLEGWLASSTFPIVIDECTNGPEWIVDILKSYLTVDSDMERKGAGAGGQFATMVKALCAALALDCNDPPSWFSEDAFLERVALDLIDSCDQQEGWFDARDAIPVGGVLAVLYEFTKDWTSDTLKAIIKTLDIPETLVSQRKDSRRKYIYIAYALGAYLCKKIFDIDTDLTHVIEIINRTRQTNFETLKAYMADQILHGIPVEKKAEAHDDPGAGQTVIDSFKNLKSPSEVKSRYYLPNHPWIKTPMSSGIFETGPIDARIEGWAWTPNNIHELQERFEGTVTKKWSLQTFAIKVQKWFDGSKSGQFWVDTLVNGEIQNLKLRAVMIPKLYFDEALPKPEQKKQK
jgi:predicted RNA-binding Zn-ribbon protein involved in translation (DUF1610 family)